METGLKILLVDDEEIVHQTLGDYLRDSGCQVEDAYDGLYALQIIQKGKFDLAVLDMAMPGLDGLSLLARIAETRPDIAVVIITGHGSMETVIQALRLGAADFITKPVKLVELDALLAKVADLRGLSPAAPRPEAPPAPRDKPPELSPEESELEQKLAATAHADYSDLAWHQRTKAFSEAYDLARRRHLGVLHSFFDDFAPRWRHPAWPAFNAGRRQADSMGACYAHWMDAQFERMLDQGRNEVTPEDLQGAEAAQSFQNQAE